MRVLVIGVTISIWVWAGAAAATPKAQRAPRSVQLISMGGQAGAKQSRAAVPVGVPPALTERDEPVAAAFRVHDLSRRWAEHQMANSFAETASQPAVPATDVVPFAAASLSIPLWMRGGSGFAGEARPYIPGCSAPAYRPAGFLRSDIEARRAGYYGMMSNIACEYGIPVGLFDAMIIRESQYQPYIYSPKSAFGLTQLMPGTAAALGVNRYDIEGNLRGGAKYLRQQLDRFGHYHLALAAYNAGPGRVRDGFVPRITETQEYVENVLMNWSRLAGLSRTATVVSGTTNHQQSAVPRLARAATVSTF